ncbi:MAG: hypothetical protein R6X25_13790 [Candidatus Krumholzibacteriia bacterium]
MAWSSSRKWPVAATVRHPVHVALVALVAVAVVLPAAGARGAQLPEDARALVPAGATAVVGFTSLAEVDDFWRELTGSDEESPAAAIRSTAPDLAGYIRDDRPVGVAVTLTAPMSPQPVSFTLVLPVQREALNPPLLRTLAGDMKTAVRGEYVGISNLALYEPSGAAALASDLPAGTMTGRMDVASVVAAYRPLVQLGLTALSQPGAVGWGADSAAPPPELEPQQVAAVQEFVLELLDGLQTLELGLENGDRLQVVTGSLAVAPQSLLDPGDQPDFQRALELTRFLPADAPLLQASTRDATRLMRSFTPVWELIIDLNARDVPAETAGAYAEWMRSSLDVSRRWMHPHAFSLSLAPEGLRMIGVLEHPEPERVMEEMMSLYTGVAGLGTGITVRELDPLTVAGVRARRFDLAVDPEQLGAVTGADSVAADPAEQAQTAQAIAAFVEQLYPTFWLAALEGHLLIVADPAEQALADLVQAVRSGGGRVNERVRESAREAGEGTTSVTLGDLRQFLTAFAGWVEAMGEPLPDLSGEPLPFVAMTGAVDTRLTFRVEADLPAFAALMDRLEEIEGPHAVPSHGDAGADADGPEGGSDQPTPRSGER